MTAEHELRRLEKLVHSSIDRVGVNLSGLAVVTEAASGPYLATAVLAAAAGARRVYAIAADTRLHRASDVERDTGALAARVGVDVDVLRAKDARALADADIVTNTGSVRPIDAGTVAVLRPTAVVTLMWETWEFLPEQVDLAACRARGVLVLGTNEHQPPCDLRPYSGLTAVKLLLALGIEVWETRVLLLGRQPLLGLPMEETLRRVGCRVTTFSRAEEGGRPYDQLEAHLAHADYDVVLVADHAHDGPMLAAGGVLDPHALAASCPAVRVGVISGLVDVDSLRAEGLLVLPDAPTAPRRHAYSLAELGPRPALELYAAGLRVGEVAARARLAGLDVGAATRRALEDAPAMAFPEAMVQAASRATS